MGPNLRNAIRNAKKSHDPDILSIAIICEVLAEEVDVLRSTLFPLERDGVGTEIPVQAAPAWELTGSEALFGFMGWLTSRRQRTTFSASDSASVACDLVTEFIRTNHLSDPRHGWETRLTHPTENESPTT